MIMSGFVSKGVNNLVDFGWKKIKDANSDRNSHKQNIETRIYQVTVDAINVFTFNEYKNQDILYYVAESILRGFKSEIENIEAVKMGLKMLDLQITDDRCADFLGTLCDEICRDENDILYKKIVVMQNEQISEDIHGGFKRSEKSHEDLRKDIHEGFERSEQNLQEAQRKLDYLVEKADDKEANFNGETVENRAEEYAAKWDKNVFLNDYNKRDKNADKNVKLRDIYLENHLPHFVWKMDDEPFCDMKELLREHIVDINNKKMLLILGQAGIGKSTLITWITANFAEKRNEILVYQFASDLKNINWQNENTLNEILKRLGVRYNELDGKILILDGFDEMHISGGREKILNQLYQELEENRLVKRFSLIITCRENYVYELNKVECEYITLKPWDTAQIQSFCRVYSEKIGKNISNYTIRRILEKEEIFGTPLILYMVLALNISIEDNGSIVDVYDRIFSLEGGSIYDRCIRNSRFAAPHRISEDKIKQQIHEISKRIAFWMFENKSEEVYIPQLEYEKICNDVIDETTDGIEDVKYDFLIGNYFKLIKHCEGIGTEELQFVHRSIYEYFVVVYFFESICARISKEDIIGQLGALLKDGYLSEEILEFIKYKFEQRNIYNMSEITKDFFQNMLRDGMTYYTKQRYNNIIERELNIFSNMLEIVCLWNNALGELNENIITYLRHNGRSKLNLKGIKLGCVDLHRVYLDGANMDDADLQKANLEGADLRRAHLRETNLNGADLQKANLQETDFIGAYLEEANLSEANLAKSDLSGVNLMSATLIGTNLNEAELVRTKLNKAVLNGANLNGAKLIYAELYGANLSEAQICGIDLSGALLKGAVFDERQIVLLENQYDLTNSKVYVFETKKIINYSEYCSRKQQRKDRNNMTFKNLYQI